MSEGMSVGEACTIDCGFLSYCCRCCKAMGKKAKGTEPTGWSKTEIMGNEHSAISNIYRPNGIYVETPHRVSIAR